MALTPLQRHQALGLLILELVVMEDRLAELQDIASKTGFTTINGSLKYLEHQIQATHHKISGRKARMEKTA